MLKSRSAGSQVLASARQTKRGIRRARHRKRVMVFLPNWEPMEDRTLLSTMDFSDSTGGDWNVAANWVNAANPTDHHVPTAADDAVIGALGSGVTVTYSEGADTVGSVTSGTNLVLSGGSLTVIGNLQMSAGVALTLAGGTLANATVTSGSTVVLTSAGGTLGSGVSFAAGSTLDGSQSPAGLVAYYNFDTGPNDVSGNGHSGTLSPNPPTLTSAGYQGGAYQFDAANNNYITAPINISPSAMPQLTMGGWFNASTANSVIRGLLSDDNGGFDRTINIDTRNGGVKWSAFDGAGVVSGAAVVADQWVFVAVCYNQAAGTMTLDVNGTMTTAATDFGSSSTATLTIGRDPNFNSPFNGMIDGVFVYNKYLTAAQLDALQNGVYANITGGLQLDGQANLGGANGGTSARLDFNGSQTLSGTGTVVFGAAAGNGLFAQGDNGSNPTTLTIGAGIAITGGSGAVSGYYSNDSVVLNGTISATTPGQILTANGGAGGADPSSSNTGPLIDQGTLDLGGTEAFTLTSHPHGGPGIILTPNQAKHSAYDISVNIPDPTTVYTLINSGYGVFGDTVGAVEFQATGGLDYTVKLVEGQDIRDYNNDGFNDTIGQGALGGDYLGSAYYGGGQVRLDEQGFVLPSSFNTATLTNIILHGYGHVYTGNPFLAAATVATQNGPVQVNINSYVNADVRNYTNGADFPLGGPLVMVGKAPMTVDGGLTIDGQGGLSISTNSTLQVTGNLLGNTTNAAGFNPLGTVVLDSTSSTASAPQLLEAMSQDMGAVAAGFNQNFAYATLTLGSNDYVELVDQSANSPGSGAEAVYANSLTVPAGTTLDLNGLNLYVRDAEISGTITGGSITQIPVVAPLTIDSPTPGTLSAAGQLDDWTFFDRGGDTVTVTLDTGSGSAAGPVTPYLNWAQVQLLDPSGNVLASTTSKSAGAILELTNVALPADGTYTIAVEAAPGHLSKTGNYVVAGYDTTPNVQPLNVNQQIRANLPTPYSTDQWTFSAAANTQVKFSLLAESASGLEFSLAGPNKFDGFTNITGSSKLVTLPTAGTYTLTAQGTGGATGNFAFEVAQTSQTSLSLGTPLSGTFAGSGQPQLFEINLPTAGPLSLQLTDPTKTDHIELYAQFGTPPTRQTYGYGATGAGSSQSLLIPSAAAGTWYVLVYAESATSSSTFTITATATPVLVTSVSPVQYGADAIATLTLNGAGFTSLSTVTLVAPDGTTTYPASSVTFNTFTQLTATVNLSGVPQGVYSIQVTNGTGGSDTLPGAFTVTASGLANLQTELILPSVIGRHISSVFYVEYSNTGSVAMPAPLLLLESSVPDDVPLFTLNKALVVSGYWTSAVPEGYSTSLEILASGKVPGVLGPGESVTVPVYYAGMVQPWNLGEQQFKFDIRIFDSTDPDPANWAKIQSATQPAGISNAAWSAVYGNLTAQLGNTWGGYVQLLDNEASYLGQLGEDVTDVSQLWNFAVQQDDSGLNPLGPDLACATDDSLAIPGSLSLSFSRVFAATIAGRDTMGPLGLGWSTPWQTTATTAGDGTVTITGAGGSRRVFQPDSRTAGAYFSEPGDTGTLTSDGQGGYLLTEADGTATDYNANGTLNYMEDTNGNRITAGYTGGLLTSLTASSGQSITIGYNSAGLISSVTDSEGRKTTYTYDAQDVHLISVTNYDGQTTSYTYENVPPLVGVNPPPSPVQNALASITFPGGTHQYFTYDSTGRLASTSSDGGAQPLSFTYDLGEVSVTDGTGDTSHMYYNEQGLMVKSIDPLGNVTLDNYDGNFNLTSITNALGESETYTYNSVGEVTSFTDFLGNTNSFTYSGPFNELSSMTDADGNTTGYSYSSGGDLLTTTYANGTSQSSTFNPEGDATSFLDANGQPIQYAYNAAGQITSETFSAGTSYTYTYNSFGAMLTATDAAGTTTFTYNPTTELLTKVAYPNALSLTFTYNAAGQRTSMVDQTGFTVNYDYDSAGRLSQLTDGSGNPIATYTYDASGRLSEKTNGNGTYTTYQYDADGNVLHLVNFAQGGAINSRFDYTYNALGLEATEATLDGTWSYTYDADGQLIHAVFASTNSSAPSQDLAYSYDAMGNRITTVINGVTTAYATNNMNQYTSVGGVADTYDADGNLTFDGTNTYAYNSLNQLISVTGPGGTTTYTYNALGQQVASTTNGQTTENLIDPTGPGNVVGQYTGSGGLIADYTYGLGLASQVTTAGSSSYDFDALGSTVGLTSPSGAYTDAYSYVPFGGSVTSTQPVANPFQFLGADGVVNESNNLQLMGARDYDDELGRFLSAAPIQLGNGNINRYMYESNAPTKSIEAAGSLSSAVIRGCSLCLSALSPLSPPSQAFPTGPGTEEDPSPYPIPPHGAIGDSRVTRDADSHDPNSMLGPDGYGSANFVTDAGAVFPYQIDFENDPTATAPAQSVTITDQLPSDLNWNSFQLTGIGWGDTILTIPAGSQYYAATVPMTYNGETFDVDVVAGINTATGQVYATFQSIDPNTGLPPDVLTGFLPPEDGTGIGMGDIGFTVQPEAGLVTGTAITNVALVSFDGNPSIATDQVNDDDPTEGVDPTKQALVTIDSVPPTSSVSSLPATTTASSFTVNMTGTDNTGGSGVGSFALYVSTDGGPFVLDQAGIPAQAGSGVTYTGSTTFAGTQGNTYAFYSVATDNAGNVEAATGVAQATTTVLPQSSLVAVGGEGTYEGTATLAATLVYGTSTLAGETVTFSLVSGGKAASVGSATTNADGVATLSGVSLAGISAAPDSSSVVAIFAGDATHAATSASSNLVINQVTPTVTWANPPEIVTGTPLSSAQLDATASIPGTFAYSPNAGTILDAGKDQTLTVTFTPSDTTDYASVSTTATINVQMATPTVTWANPAGITYGTPLGATQLGAMASVPGTYVYSPAAGTVLKAGAGQVLSVTFTPSDWIDYTAVTTTATINVQQATPVITWANPANIVYGTVLSGIQLDATASVPGTFAYGPASGSVPNAGPNQPLTVRFIPSDSNDYRSTTATANLDVLAAPLTVAVKPATRFYGQANPAFTVSYSGFVRGQGPGALTGALAFGTTAVPSSNLGNYAVQASGLSSRNYTVSYEPGVLTVDPEPLTFTAVNTQRKYKARNPRFTYTESGFVLGQTANQVFKGTPSLSTNATKNSPAGQYWIVVSQGKLVLTNKNYTFQFVKGFLEVTG